MSLQNHAGELLVSATKATPPLAASGAVLAGLALNEWVLIATLVYTLLQIALLVRKIIRMVAAKDIDDAA